MPFAVAPKVGQQQSQSDKAQGFTGRCGSGTHGVHQVIAGFDTEPRVVFLEELSGSKLQLT